MKMTVCIYSTENRLMHSPKEECIYHIYTMLQCGKNKIWSIHSFFKVIDTIYFLRISRITSECK